MALMIFPDAWYSFSLKVFGTRKMDSGNDGHSYVDPSEVVLVRSMATLRGVLRLGTYTCWGIV